MSAQITWAEMADAAEIDLLGKQQRIEQCRKNPRWPVTDIAIKESQIPIFEEIARRLRDKAEREAQV